jgi:hypothetical protein
MLLDCVFRLATSGRASRTATGCLLRTTCQDSWRVFCRDQRFCSQVLYSQNSTARLPESSGNQRWAGVSGYSTSGEVTSLHRIYSRKKICGRFPSTPARLSWSAPITSGGKGTCLERGTESRTHLAWPRRPAGKTLRALPAVACRRGSRDTLFLDPFR